MRNLFLSLSLIAVATLVAGSSSAFAATNVTRNGVLWAGTFEGDVSPLTASSPAWGVFDNNGFAAESSDGNIYSYLSGSVGTAVSYEQASSFAGTGTQNTVEIRVRVPDATAQAGDGAGGLVVGQNDNAYDTRFFTTGVAYNFGGLNTVWTGDLTQFRTFRITVDQTASPVYSLYVDGNPTPVFTSNGNWFTSPGFNKLVFGDYSTGGMSGKIDVDYISWTPGIHAPVVPEPTTLGALSVLSALLIRRR